jgi:hypothetical protein
MLDSTPDALPAGIDYYGTCDLPPKLRSLQPVSGHPPHIAAKHRPSHPRPGSCALAGGRSLPSCASVTDWPRWIAARCPPLLPAVPLARRRWRPPRAPVRRTRLPGSQSNAWPSVQAAAGTFAFKLARATSRSRSYAARSGAQRAAPLTRYGASAPNTCAARAGLPWVPSTAARQSRQSPSG